MTAPYWPDSPRVLASYAYPEALSEAVSIPGIDLMVDSGAFTADSVGKKISLTEYCEWLSAHARAITTAVVLDVIGDWRATARNHERMLTALPPSLCVLPVWHATSPLSELDRLCQAHDYVGIGGVTTMAKSVKQFMQHSIRAHRVAQQHGTRLHGLGVTGRTAMMRLPWSTVDSSTWLAGARYGKIALYDAGQRYYQIRMGAPLTREESHVVRAYGWSPAQVARKGFGMKSGGGDYRAEYQWAFHASARAIQTVEGHLRVKHQQDTCIYLACSSPTSVQVVAAAHRAGSPFTPRTAQ